MQTETLHLHNKDTHYRLFRMGALKMLTFLLIIIVPLSTCLFKQSDHPDRKGKRCASSQVEPSPDPLKSLLTHLRLTDSDLKVEPPERNQDYFR